MKKILVIDDEPLILKMLIRYLGAEGYDVLTAKDRRSAFPPTGQTVRYF
jgi:DNA-binding response OmpR family regulator